MRKKLLLLLLCTCLIFTNIFCYSVSADSSNLSEQVSYIDGSDLVYDLMEYSTTYVLAKHKAFGGSHYAYTEGLYEESTGDAATDVGTECNFFTNSSLVLVTLEAEGDKVKVTEKTIFYSRTGCVRDPNVSADGTKMLFSLREKRADDFHIYEMELTSGKYEYRQLTFGSGVADYEPIYLPNGEILFSSTRAIQTVDCWKTPVSNLYKMSADGKNIVRLGYDQVHTTYPTLTEDGRVIYTRWDYNDRTQVYIQGMFQMNPDGTNQTELFGNNSSFPTTLIHTRAVEGENDLYVSIATGHHTYQAGEIVFIDVSEGRDNPDAITFAFPDETTTKEENVDIFGQGEHLYQYPYAINSDQFLVSYSPKGWSTNKQLTPFGIYIMDRSTGEQIELIKGSDIPAAQIVPVKTSKTFIRPSMVDYTKNTGTYYIGDVYTGEAMKGVERGTVKQIRVVALDYRPYAVGGTVSAGVGGADIFTPIATGNGAWDIKQVLGVATVYDDGSAMFSVPSETPVYFQLLDEDGNMIQTMRSWSTLMPNEIYSCVGCHEDNNTVPPAAATVTMASKAGVEALKPDVWQTEEDYDPYKTLEGFSYLEEVQPILDANCISCHNDKNASYDMIKAEEMKENEITITPKEEREETDKPFSLEGTLVGSDRMGRYFPLSYLVLTNSTPRGNIQWVGVSNNSYINWLTSMSAAQIQQPNLFGSSSSNMIKMLKEGHNGVELTENELRTLSAWIDLCVPCYGEYDANNSWNTKETKEAEEEQNKRDYYNMMNDYARMALSGTLPKGELKITYKSGSKVFEDSGEGIVNLYVPQIIRTTDTITVTLPEGVKYIGFTLTPKMGESIIYCPNGTFTYKVPDATSLVSTLTESYKNTTNYVTARIVTQQELSQKHNLAENTYDYTNNSSNKSDVTDQYPHATASSEWENNRGSGETAFLARNAIDGFANNKGHGNYPLQSWGPANKNWEWLKIDFGRAVNAEELGVVIRYDNGHDTWFKTADVEVTYEDGTTETKSIQIIWDEYEQIFDLELTKPITSIKLQKLVADTSGGWAAFTEVNVYGTEK